MILSGADNRPHMLDKDLYDSWKSRVEIYMQNRKHGRMILESIDHGPLIWPTVEENGVIKTKKYAKLSAAEKIQADCDMKATNIILQDLLVDIYSFMNHHRVAKDLWERIQLLMQCTSLIKQERECKLYDAFDKFTHIKGESLHTYYLRFTQLINDMNIYKMKMEQLQVNTKFLNSLPPELSKFVTDVKLVTDLHTSNFDQIHAYLEQHELHANKVRIMRERNQDPLAFIANQQMIPPHFNTYQSSYNNPQIQQQFSPSQHGPIQPNQHYSPYYPSQLNSIIHLTSSNKRNQPTIQDGRVTMQQVQGRQGQNYSGTMYKGNATSSRGNTTSGQARVIKCYNCQEAQEAGQILDEEELAFLADPGILVGQAQTIIPHNAAFQTEDLNTYDSECDDLSTAQADFEQSPVMDFTYTEISSDSNIIPYSQYLQETPKAIVQDTNLQAQQDSMILSLIEQISEQMINHVNNWEKANKEQNNESIIVELERYKEMRSKPTLDDGIVIFEKHVAMPVIDEEETLILEELNRLIENFGKRFTPQQELSAEQAFWLCISNPTIESSSTPPVRVEVPSKLPKRTTPNALTEEIPEYFEKNDLKAQLQDKDTTIRKLKDTIKSLRKKNKEEIVDHDRCNLVTINEELENSVAK
nr:hypothetical protein [Tanacetum cinerariifolium]